MAMDAPQASNKRPPYQIVLVLQGGGALGAYQAGVYQALHEAGIEPDWVIGTSIGAINAGLIAGNAPENRLPRIEEFWRRMRATRLLGLGALARPRQCGLLLVDARRRHSGFFEPNPFAFFGAHYPLGADQAGFYSTAPLAKTLRELVDIDDDRAVQPAAHRRRRACAIEPHALFRQPRDRDYDPPHHGLGRAAAGFSAGPPRRRALLGWRHPFQHAD